MAASHNKHLLAALWRSVRVWFFGAIAIAALSYFYYFLTTLGPRKINNAPSVVSAPDDPAIARLSDEVGDLEKRYRQAADANLVTTESVDALEKAVEKQKELLRTFANAGLDQSTRLVRLETELDSVRAREKVMMVDRLEKDGEELLNADKADEAGDKLREALKLQREINQSSASSRYKNYVRETSLAQLVAAVEAAPLHREVEAALAAARKAADEQRWADALTAYTTARDTQARINREFGRTRYADLAGADRMSSEIESLNAAGIAADIDAREKAGDQAVLEGRPAATLFEEAETLQLQVNQNYPRSRFVSSQRIEDLEVKRQTALSSDTADSIQALDRAIAAHLLKRQVVAAEQKITEAAPLIEKLFRDFPKSRRLDGALRIKFAYLMLRRADLRALQDEVYDLLLPLPGFTDRLMLKTEVPQSLYVRVMSTNPSRNPGRTLPVDSVNWTDAQEFCMRLSWMLGAPVRLPTADEFRVALGDAVNGNEAWGSHNSDGHSHEVGRQKPNSYGFVDLLGNLGEWALASTEDAKAPVFGGSYLNAPEVLAKVPGEQRDKSDRARHVGLRILIEL